MFKGSSRMYLTHLNIAHYVHKARLQNLFHFFPSQYYQEESHFKEQKTEVQKSRDWPKSSDFVCIEFRTRTYVSVSPERGAYDVYEA